MRFRPEEHNSVPHDKKGKDYQEQFLLESVIFGDSPSKTFDSLCFPHTDIGGDFQKMNQGFYCAGMSIICFLVS
jgi:hypothetical protein